MDAPLFSRRRLVATATLAPLALAGATGPARAQTPAFPSRPLRIVVPFAPGGPTDLLARTLGKPLSQALGQPVVVDNKPGGGGVIGLTEVARSPADGHTLAFPSILAVTNQTLIPGYPFDIARDFTPVTVVAFIPHMLVVRAESEVKSLAELVALAQRKPDSVSYGSSGIGTSAHLAGAVFAERAGLRLVHVPYRGAGPALQDLLGGQIHAMFLDLPSALSQVRAGKLRPLGIATAQRNPVASQVGTIAEQGYPGFAIRTWYGLLLRAQTPQPVVDRLYQEVRQSLAAPEMTELLRAQGMEPGAMPPAEFAALIRDDLQRWKQVIERLKIKAD